MGIINTQCTRTNDPNAPFHTTEYCGNHIYDNGELKQTLFDGGYLTYDGETPIYHFYVKDHLGNNRMVLDESGNVEQVTHYYPYGMSFAEGKGKDVQKYKYNGKELDAEDGLNWMDYGARMYDGALARWNGVDALAEKNNSQSPYGYCVGNPVKYVDVDGRDWLIYYKDNKGNVATYRFRGYTTSDIPNNRFVNQVITAYNYNVNNGGGDPSFNSATDKSNSIFIVESNINSVSDQNVVFWNPYLGIKYDSGNVGSPASVLDHEVDHAYDYVLNPVGHTKQKLQNDEKYRNAEEKRVISGSEVKTARCNGEIKKNQVTRINHDGYEVCVDGGVTSTKINIENTKKYHKNDVNRYETDY